MPMTRTPSNRIELKADTGSSGGTPTPLQEDKNGQAVVNSGAGTARKPTKSSGMYLVDAAGNKIEATIGKERFEFVKDDSVPATGGNTKPTTPPGDTKSGGTTPEQAADAINKAAETGVYISPETTTKDSGIGAMLGQSNGEGLTHSWDKEAKQYADKLYQQGKVEAESEYSVKASELKTEAQTSQEDLEMQKYTNAQTADKLGWTGGYILDQQRQMSVLKAGIQAQLFNTQELNRLGLESSLAAARLNADLKNQELAHQYYQDAITNAINTANVTGYYLSPEASDYLTQQRAAEQIMATSDPNSAEYAKAQNVINYVDNYFSENGLTKQGTKTLALISHELQQDQFELEKKQLEISYIMASKQSTEYTEGKAGLYYDESGNTAFAGTSEDDPIGSGPDLINFSSIEPTELERICNLNSEGKNSSFYEQCVTYKLEEIAKLYNNFLSTQGLSASEDSWKTFQENPTNKALIDNFNAIKNINITAFDKETILNGTAIPTSNFTLDSSLNMTFTPKENQKNDGDDGEDKEENKTLTDKILTTKDDVSSSVTYDEILNTEEGSHDYTSHVTYKVQDSAINGKGIDDDFDVNIYWDGKETKNYDLDVDWEYGSGWSRFWASNNFGDDHEIGGVKGKDAWNKAQSYLTSTYGKQSKDNFVIYGGYLWYYNAKLNKWGYVQNNAGGGKLLDDLKEAASGSRPARWQ